uniref:Uncharacterized protein n=1 Tax=Vespula pensylvanica TaxID=30213 RepID=A0A834UEI3_VESPE|nr:hypothetical protein H0235_002657 [Vespula pensylvanica]
MQTLQIESSTETGLVNWSRRFSDRMLLMIGNFSARVGKQREAEATARAEATTATGQRILPGHRQDAHSSHTYASLWGIIGRQTN